MKTGRSSDAILPRDLMAEVEAAAAEEHRSPRELVSEAVERYLSQRSQFRPDEVHEKIARGLASLQQGRSLDGESVMAELIGGYGESVSNSCVPIAPAAQGTD